MIYLAFTLCTDTCLSPLCRQNGKEASRLPSRFVPMHDYILSKPMRCAAFPLISPLCAKRKRSKQIAFALRTNICLHFKQVGEMRRFFAYLPSVRKTEKKQADCLPDLRRRMLILQANRGGEMRRLFFVLLFPGVFEGCGTVKYRHLFGAVNILAEVACS